MGSSKSVIYINVTQLGKLISESCHCLFWAFYFVALIVFVFSFFFSVKSHIFAEENFIVGFVDLVENTVTDAVFQEGDFSIEERREMFSNGFEGHFGVFFAIGSSEMREENERLGIVLGNGVNGGEGF